MELRDKNGLTEREFLASYDAGKYPRPSLTADVAIVARTPEGARRLLLIRRGGHPHLGRWALPGGFANKNEPLEQTAARELLEETGVSGVSLRLVGVFSKPGRDPRGWTVTGAYMAEVEAGSVRAEAGDDAAEARWFDVLADGDRLTLRGAADTLTIDGGAEAAPDGPKIAFDHAEIIAAALRMTE